MTRRRWKRFYGASPNMRASAAVPRCWKPRLLSMAGIRVALNQPGTKRRNAGRASSRRTSSGNSTTSKRDGRDHRHMVRRARPAAYALQDRVLGDAVAKRAADPNVIKPAAAVGSLPVLRAIAPPRIDLFLCRYDAAG